MTSSTHLSYVLMFVAGVGIPIMAALNAGLGRALQQPMAAVLVLCSVALVFSALLLYLLPGAEWSAMRSVSPIHFAGGALFVLYIGSITYATPIIGLGNAVFLVLMGQLVCAAIIDHFALFGVPQSAISLRRLVGIGVMVLGVYLARKDIVQSLPSMQ